MWEGLFVATRLQTLQIGTGGSDLATVSSQLTLRETADARDSQAFLAALFASSDDPIIGKTLDGTVVQLESSC